MTHVSLWPSVKSIGEIIEIWRLTMDAEPTPKPITSRPTVICAIVKEVAWSRAPIVKRTEANQIAGFLPYLSAVIPAMTAPIKAPAAVTAVINSFSE